jgi:hypothetical protein
MYLPEASEQNLLFKSLKQREEELQVQSLPLVLLAPSNLAVDQRALLGRIHKVVKVPANPKQIVETINSLVAVERC